MSNTSTFKSAALKDFDPFEWHFFGLWKQDLFSSCFWSSCFDSKLLADIGFDVPDLGTLILNGGNFFYNKTVVAVLRERLAETMRKKETTHFKRLSDRAYQTYTEGVAFAECLSEESAISIDLFNEFLFHGRKMSLYWCFAAVHLPEIFEKAFQDRVIEEGITSEIAVSLIPVIKTPLLDQQKELRGLKGEIGDRTFEETMTDERLAKKLEEHRVRYAWIEIANWIGDELTTERLFEQIRHVEEKSEPKDIAAASSELAYLAECLGYIGHTKQAGAECVAMLAQRARPFLTRIAKSFGLTYREMMLLTHEEILNGLAHKKSNEALRKIVESESRRTTRWMVVTKDHHESVFIEDSHQIDLLKQAMIPKTENGAQEVRGKIGNPGIARGTARIILNVDDFHKMQAGEILITTMTTPDFVILMQKAAAIVTDIGGLLSHAAIVSREINKPCIIGTKIATKVFKDGDMVEVDAERGVVRIIS